jgi:hypothetical protein
MRLDITPEEFMDIHLENYVDNMAVSLDIDPKLIKVIDVKEGSAIVVTIIETENVDEKTSEDEATE